MKGPCIELKKEIQNMTIESLHERIEWSSWSMRGLHLIT